MLKAGQVLYDNDPRYLGRKVEVVCVQGSVAVCKCGPRQMQIRLACIFDDGEPRRSGYSTSPRTTAHVPLTATLSPESHSGPSFAHNCVSILTRGYTPHRCLAYQPSAAALPTAGAAAALDGLDYGVLTDIPRAERYWTEVMMAAK